MFSLLRKENKEQALLPGPPSRLDLSSAAPGLLSQTDGYTWPRDTAGVQEEA